MRGFYYQHAAKLKWEEKGSRSDEEVRALADADRLKSSEEYLTAAGCYPADDEKHICEPIRFSKSTTPDVASRLIGRVPTRRVQRAVRCRWACEGPSHDVKQAARGTAPCETDLGV